MMRLQVTPTDPPVPRPDFVLLKGTATVAILDAKYRDLWATKLPREMLYQLALYAAASDGRTAAILYPTPAADAREQRIRVNDPLGGEARAEVVLRPVVLSRLEMLIEAGDTATATRSRVAYAAWLGTGHAA